MKRRRCRQPPVLEGQGHRAPGSAPKTSDFQGPRLSGQVEEREALAAPRPINRRPPRHPAGRLSKISTPSPQRLRTSGPRAGAATALLPSVVGPEAP